MSTVRPFVAVRPTRDKVHLVASRSYVSYTRKDLRDKLHGNPYSFLHIIHPDLGSRKLHKAQINARFHLVRKRYEQFMEEGILVRDDQPCFFIYRQIKNGHPFTGLIAAIAVDDYRQGKIKVHEHTLSKRQSTFTHYLETTAINAEPVLLMGPSSPSLDDVFQRYLDQRPEYDFSSTSKVRHQVWVINREEDIADIQRIYGEINHLYIADGHHRSASSLALNDKWMEEGIIQSPDHPANYFLAYILDEESVRIYEFNRLVKDLNGMSPEEFIQHLHTAFYINEAPAHYRPVKKGEFSMYLAGQWYCLTVKRHSHELDTEVLATHVLRPLLNVQDPRTDKRIAFMEGPRGPHAMKTEIDKGRFAVGFGLFPVSSGELKTVADRNQFMPPKSTWVEPKLRSGLVIYELT